jgi:hypothetical protein
MQSASASMVRPSAPLKNCHGPSLKGDGGLPAFGTQGSRPAIVTALTLVEVNRSIAVPIRKSLRRTLLIGRSLPSLSPRIVYSRGPFIQQPRSATRSHRSDFLRRFQSGYFRTYRTRYVLHAEQPTGSRLSPHLIRQHHAGPRGDDGKRTFATNSGAHLTSRFRDTPYH